MVGDCILGLVSKWRFEAPEGGSVTVRKTFVFQPEESVEDESTTAADSCEQAQTSFIEAESAFVVWVSRDTGNTMEERQIAIAQQLEEIPPILEKFSAVIQIGCGNWTAAAYYRLGSMYAVVAENLLNSPMPPEIETDPDLASAYAEELATVAGRFQDEALANWRVGLTVCDDLGVENSWSALIRGELALDED